MFIVLDALRCFPESVLILCIAFSVLSCFSCFWLFVTTWTVAHQAPLSIWFSRQGYWSGLPYPPPGDLPAPGTEPASFVLSPALLADSEVSLGWLIMSHWGSPVAFLGARYRLPTYWHSLAPIHESFAILDCICPFAFDINEAQGIPLVQKWRFNVWLNVWSCYVITWEGLHGGSREELLLDGVVSYTENEDFKRLK